MTRIVLVNPNTLVTTTLAMCAEARMVAGSIVVDGRTASLGAAVIADEAALATAAAEVGRMVAALGPGAADGVLIGAFGDPGLAAARRSLTVPVIGLGEASIEVALATGGRFAVITTTPALHAAIHRMVDAYGATAAFAGVFYTRSGVAGMTEPDQLADELLRASEEAGAAQAATIIVGGGPLVTASRALRGRMALPMIEPVASATQVLLARIELSRL